MQLIKMVNMQIKFTWLTYGYILIFAMPKQKSKIQIFLVLGILNSKKKSINRSINQ